MKVYIVAGSYDGIEVKEFTDKPAAEQFCAEFLARHRTNEGCIQLAVEGIKLDPQVVDVVKAIELKRI